MKGIFEWYLVQIIAFAHMLGGNCLIPEFDSEHSEWNTRYEDFAHRSHPSL
jgi:hypothetical protein